jgi:branched-chain amino acid transport system permease protein
VGEGCVEGMSSLSLVLEAAVLGLLSGGVYALMASGLTLIFGVMRIINVGQGALVLLGSYLSLVLLRRWGIDPFLGLLLTLPTMFLLGVAIELVFIRPLKTDREALSVLVTYALALGIEGILAYFFSADFQQLTVPYDTAGFALGGLHVTYVYVFGFLLCLAIQGALFLLLYRSTFGASIRATMLNRSAAQLIGIDVERVSAVAFGIGMATAAAGGVVFGITTTFHPGSHYDLISRLLAIVVLGGLGSLRGAIIAALVMLVGQDITSVLVSPTWAEFVFFAVLVVVLLVRPQGLYGSRIREQA